MKLTAVLLRWYRSFNTASTGPEADRPFEPWNTFRGEYFPFVAVPIDPTITTIVGANESGKSHLLSAISKAMVGVGLPGPVEDRYEVKDICRYCGFSALDKIWPEIGLQLSVEAQELADLVPGRRARPVTTEVTLMTVILNCSDEKRFATRYLSGARIDTLTRDQWNAFARKTLPKVMVLDSSLALPNDVHIDELIDLYDESPLKPVVEPLAMQDIWRYVRDVNLSEGLNAAEVVTSFQELRTRIDDTTRTLSREEKQLVHLLFAQVLRVSRGDLDRVRRYGGSERGYVSWITDAINGRLERELDISRYWDQDEDFRLTVNYKGGVFHFQITDRTGSGYTFNERSSGLRYFLSYYIQAKAAEAARGASQAIILMDEPDNYLSASGQRSLLRVFDSLVDVHRGPGCQLVYSTHSPFMINRNFPQRIRLVRKGDGSEGSQYVKEAAIRRFEPVRSALAIDAADTLFLGTINVVLEGAIDQKVLIGCVQKFGKPGRLDEWLDLNALTIVASGGAQFAVELVSKATKGDEKPPIVVVLLDGDPAGESACPAIQKFLGPGQVCTLKEVEIPGKLFVEIEDVVPQPLLLEAARWFCEGQGMLLGEGSAWNATVNHADALVQFCRANCDGLTAYSDLEIRAGVVDVLLDRLGDVKLNSADLEELSQNVQRVCRKISGMVENAIRHSTKHSLQKGIRVRCDVFAKRFRSGALKGDVRRLLAECEALSAGPAEDSERTRHNVSLLLKQLDKEATQNSDPVSIADWRTRLDRLKEKPWGIVQDWGTVKGPVNSAEAAAVNPRASKRRGSRAAEKAPAVATKTDGDVLAATATIPVE